MPVTAIRRGVPDGKLLSQRRRELKALRQQAIRMLRRGKKRLAVVDWLAVKLRLNRPGHGLCDGRWMWIARNFLPPIKVSRPPHRPIIVYAGGQTGVDRAAFDAAIKLDISHFGYCPRGRKAEDGRIPDRYDVEELPTVAYRARTEQNVESSDATLLLTMGPPKGGSALTAEYAAKHRKPLLHIDLSKGTRAGQAKRIRSWMRAKSVRHVNIAGPRESMCPGIGNKARNLLIAAWR